MSDPLNSDAMRLDEFEHRCATCGNVKWWQTCWNCGGEGYSDHDCGEDCCACLHPENNVRCDICRGKEGYYVCAHCHPESFDD